MPREQIPKIRSCFKNLITNGLSSDCEHKHAVPVSNLFKLTNWKTSNITFSRTRHIWNIDHQLLYWVGGNHTTHGYVSQKHNEYCCFRQRFRLCFARMYKRNQEVSIEKPHDIWRFSNFLRVTSVYQILQLRSRRHAAERTCHRFYRRSNYGSTTDELTRIYHFRRLIQKINRVRGKRKNICRTRRAFRKRNTQKIAEGEVVCRSNQHSRLSLVQLFFCRCQSSFFFSFFFFYCISPCSG